MGSIILTRMRTVPVGIDMQAPASTYSTLRYLSPIGVINTS